MIIDEVASNLKKNWKKWSIVTRSNALNRLKLAGYSGYQLAELVGCSEANIRKVLEVAHMSVFERSLIQAGESLRKVRKIHHRRKKDEGKTAQEIAISRGYRKLQLWLRTARLAARFEEQLFLEILASDRGAQGPPCSLKTPDLLARTKPAGFDHASGIDRFNLEIDWLFSYAHYEIPDGEVRQGVLRRALSRAGRNLEPPIL